MYNTGTYNNSLYNAPALTATLDYDDLVFNGLGLQNENIFSSWQERSMPRRNVNTFEIPREHGQGYIDSYFRTKQIRVEGTIVGTSKEDLESRVFEFKKKLAEPQKPLWIKYADGTTREFTATLTNPDSLIAQEFFHLNWTPFVAVFTCYEPFGKSLDYESEAFFGQSTLAFTETMQNNGNTWAKPIIIFNFSAANAVTAVSVKNNDLNQEIELSASISAGDYLRFDSETREVTLNGVVQDFDGVFPDLKAGGNSFTTTITATSATYTATYKSKKSYL